jgi:molybdopterin synthase sulfur carrier subunit
LRQSILRDYPAFGSIELLRIAVDQSYADDAQTIQGDEEIALILPVSGG